MLRNVLKIILTIILLILFFIANLYSSYVLPYPWSNINLLISFLLIFLSFWGSGSIVWLAFFAGFLSDLYSDVYFGVFSITFTATFLIIYWLYYEIFTNRSIWSLTIMSVVTFLIFHFIYSVLTVINGILPKVTLLKYYAWEVLLTTIFVFIVYFILEKVFVRFRIIK
ncbi:MAG: hypothetical protein A2493_01485 [Candidatus Magasanikbacteria bacterium RIFOXYC12_FULL_33_11]|uniref:Rod shape-determining protein MreD n=1 Tax=Candidatus Magasanikbacteria bacterium RIFOXYC12_FULL_33_11 TaxID=1798701 RepID=A0A1F6NQ81_9BACT|nr:MAG: hypothetical protein A2493_01485 [Candidatus Magasanikbacteria bacterium RIFOXYC12_FULL_33_11]